MTVSSVGSANPCPWPAQFPATNQADASGSPSDPLLSLFNALSGTASSPAAAPAGNTPPPGQPISPGTMSALLSAQSQTGSPGSALIAKFDTDGDGLISKSEFETAIGPNADTANVDTLFSALDANGDGEISSDELTAAQQKAHGHHHHHHHHAPPPDVSQQTSDPLQALFGVGATANAPAAQPATTTSTAAVASSSPIPALPQLGPYLEQLISQQAQLTQPSTLLTV